MSFLIVESLAEKQKCDVIRGIAAKSAQEEPHCYKVYIGVKDDDQTSNSTNSPRNQQRKFSSIIISQKCDHKEAKSGSDISTCSSYNAGQRIFALVIVESCYVFEIIMVACKVLTPPVLRQGADIVKTLLLR